MVVTSAALAAGQISVQTEWKSFKCGLKNRQRITDENCSWQQVPHRQCWKPESMPNLLPPPRTVHFTQHLLVHLSVS